MRERITLHRRDIQKLIEAALEEDVPGDWVTLWQRFSRRRGDHSAPCIAE